MIKIEFSTRRRFIAHAYANQRVCILHAYSHAEHEPCWRVYWLPHFQAYAVWPLGYVDQRWNLSRNHDQT